MEGANVQNKTNNSLFPWSNMYYHCCYTGEVTWFDLECAHSTHNLWWSLHNRFARTWCWWNLWTMHTLPNMSCCFASHRITTQRKAYIVNPPINWGALHSHTGMNVSNTPRFNFFVQMQKVIDWQTPPTQNVVHVTCPFHPQFMVEPAQEVTCM